MNKSSLQALINSFPQTFQGSFPDTDISGIALDSRQVNPGDIFFALEGGNQDGHQFIPEAIAKGAAAVVGTKPYAVKPIPYLRVEDGRLALAQLSAAFFDFPGRELNVIGVTGTDGKTTTANLIYQILVSAGYKAGMISTVNALIGDQVLDTGFHVTTPEAPDVQRYLAQMVEAGISHVVLEATSHGLEQQRVASCEFDVAVVTNITHEHLDFHGSFEDYRLAKSRLFRELSLTPAKKMGNPSLAVLNMDDDSFEYLFDVVENLPAPVSKVTYGVSPGADYHALNVTSHSSGLKFSFQAENIQSEIRSDLLGAYNVSNCLAAIAATHAGFEVDEEYLRLGIAKMQKIPGRMEIIDFGQDFLAIVDFAHTPNALERALQTARELTEGRVIAVFGSAGLRDKFKRRMMAESAAQLADVSILTAEDPRIESLDEILAEMAAGAQSQGGQEGKSFWRVPDRGEAIRFAVQMAKPGDLVISCGKGHEQSMCFGEIEFPWDDRTAMRAALAELLGVPGPQMPFLPTKDESFSGD
ncbi:MAG: UDP-N-acetylmuramoyl-L-alanyl-D-glutamate--2,6-diaminopimelate ligase [Chloroflexota bacterium]|nr:MAG: UDP-N-acetylmuramoyl-L-alanyl-D-glutamate--2,6-diaminopimelate ligase [Chloroflexota bacterium]